jgi:acetone carboxylase gamma subunit
MTDRISSVLDIVDEQIKCGKCGYDFGPSNGDWKAKAVTREQPMNNAGGAAYHSGSHVLLRTFVCPGCARLLATETTIANEPYLKNVLAKG